MKNIAIFCDGTWQNLSQRFPTNVTRLARAVTPFGRVDGHDTTQVVYYDDGVGVGNGVLDHAQRLLGGAFGEGLDGKVARAYEFLCLNYTPGDRIFIFGFSRGAYTARSLGGLLRRAWILKRQNIGLIEQAIDIYRNHSRDAVETAVFRKNNCYDAALFLRPRAIDPKAATADNATADRPTAAIQYIGVWDTVGSLGVPEGLPFADRLNDKYRFHDQSLSRFVVSARHAVAIDERRSSFAPALWDNIAELNANAGAGIDSCVPGDRPYQQTWFPGHHGSVGGGEDDGGISILPLLWIAEGAIAAGLEFDDDLLAIYHDAADAVAPFPATPRTFGDIVLQATGQSDRTGPGAADEISDAAVRRWRGLATYRPQPLQRWAADLDHG